VVGIVINRFRGMPHAAGGHMISVAH